MLTDYVLNKNNANLSDVMVESSSLKVRIVNMVSRFGLEYQRVKKFQINYISIINNQKVMGFSVSKSQPSRR